MARVSERERSAAVKEYLPCSNSVSFKFIIIIILLDQRVMNSDAILWDDVVICV